MALFTTATPLQLLPLLLPTLLLPLLLPAVSACSCHGHHLGLCDPCEDYCKHEGKVLASCSDCNLIGCGCKWKCKAPEPPCPCNTPTQTCPPAHTLGACCHGNPAGPASPCETQNWSPATCVPPYGTWCNASSSTAAIAAAGDPAGDGPVVHTPLGDVQGNDVLHAATGTAVHEFLGIPYAKSPTGSQRFRPAAQVDPWPTTLDATMFRNQCPQFAPFSQLPMGEDCLNLNIWKRAGVTAASKLPVMFFIHGGGFMSGSGALYNGTGIVAEAARAGKDVVVVTINYRLGGLGLLASEAFAKEDAAWPSTGGVNFLNDQVVALTFARAIAESFGGDVDRVMVFGESAGALSTCMLTLIPSAKGLFRSALMESGPCNGPWGPVLESVGLSASAAYMQSLNATTPAALRALPWTAFVGGAPTPKVAQFPLPSVDGFVLPKHPNEILAAGGPINPSRVVVGSNAFDSLAAKPYKMFAPGHPQPTTQAEFLALLAAANISSSVAATVADSYIDPPTKYGSITQGWVKLTADVCVICPSAFLSQTYTVTGTPPPATWEYEFMGPKGLAPHAGELAYVFGPYFAASVCGPPENLCPSPFNASLSKDMMTAWREYAHGASPWPEHSQHLAYRKFGLGDEVTESNMRGAQCAALAAELTFLQMTSVCFGL